MNRPRKPRNQTTRQQQRGRSFEAIYHRNQEETASKSTLRRRYGSYLMLITVLVVLLGYGWFSYIHEIEVRGVSDEDAAADIKQAAEEHFRFFHQVRDENLEAFRLLQQEHIAQVDTRRNFLDRRLLLEVAERYPVLRWETGDDLHFIDEYGVVVEREEGASDLPLVEDRAGLPVEEQEQVLPSAFVEFARQLEASELLIDTMYVLDTTSELYVEPEGEEYYIRLATDEDLSTQLDNITRIQQVADQRGDQIAEYIDVRIQHKGYYR